jgi:hypothetical protein
MGVLNFQTSRKTYVVNDGCEISFDPTDISFVNRLFDLMEKMEKQQNEKPENPEDVFKVFAEKDKMMRAEIDAVFEDEVCKKVFGTTNIFSPAGGLPLCMNFLLAVIDEVSEASEKEIKPSDRVNAYIQKYDKKYGKYVRK